MNISSTYKPIFNSIKLKRNRVFISLFILMFILLVSCFWGINQLLSYNNLNKEILTINNSLLITDSWKSKFLSYDRYSTEFYDKVDSVKLADLNTNLNSSFLLINELQNNAILESMNCKDSLLSISLYLISYQVTLNHMISIIHKKGFENYGLEGKLRKSIHEIEESSYLFDKHSLLMLRRHEKDFLLRKDMKYFHKFNDELELFRKSIIKNPPKVQDTLNALINDYNDLFHKIVSCDITLGLNIHTGMNAQTLTYSKILHHKIKTISHLINNEIDNLVLFDKIVITLIIIFVFLTSSLLIFLENKSEEKEMNEVYLLMEKENKEIEERNVNEMEKLNKYINELEEKNRQEIRHIAKINQLEHYCKTTSLVREFQKSDHLN